MTQEQYRKHLILKKEYPSLSAKKELAIIDYCSMLVELTRVTQNISPMPGPGGGSHDTYYDEQIFKLAMKYMEVADINARCLFIESRVRILPLEERFVVQCFYFKRLDIKSIAKLMNVSRRQVEYIKSRALTKIAI